MDNAQPIIVKKINKGGHGHHGGAWKVAFADFVTAMMAFFLLMWLMGSTTPEEKAAISDFFQNPSAVQGPGGASTSMIKLGGVGNELKKQDKDKDKGESSDTKTEKPESKSSTTTEAEKIVEIQKDAERLDNLKQDMEKAIAASQAMKPFKDQLLLDITSEGLRIQIIDKEGRPMFSVGSSSLKSYTKAILKEMAVLINRVPNKISLTGHTDATPYSSYRGYSNWELSSDRANASRRELEFGGLGRTKIAKVVGLSSTVLFDKKNPKNPVNRRISLIVMNKATEAALMRDGGMAIDDSGSLKDALGGSANGLIKTPAGTMPGDLPAKSGTRKQGPTILKSRQRVPTSIGSLKPASIPGKSAGPGKKKRQPLTLGKSATRPITGQSPRSKPDRSKTSTSRKAPGNATPIQPIKPIIPFKIP